MRKKAEPKTASEAEPARAFEFEGREVAPGTTRHFDVRVARLPAGAWLSMPVTVVHGTHEGANVWISAAVHGDELNGVAIVRGLLRRLDPARLSGTLIAVPMVNIFGVTLASRYLPDRRDLNRSFPGSPRGSLAARLAHLFFEQVVSRCGLGIDYHTGSAGRFNLPQIRCNLADLETERLATAFAAPLVLHSDASDGTLRAEAAKRGIRSLLFEAGEAGRIDSTSVRIGVDGTLRVMAALGMLEDAPAVAQSPLTSRSSGWIRAQRSGFCMLEVEVGQRVDAGQRLGMVVDATSAPETIVSSKGAGVVIGALKTAVVHRGDALVHIADVVEAEA
jgi:predicted deacylase